MRGPQSPHSEPSDPLHVTVMAMVLASVIGAAAMWQAMLTFLTRLAVMAPADADVVVQVPGGAGVGLDAPRCWIAVALAMALIGLAVRHQWQADWTTTD